MPGATAAFALDDQRAEASARDGLVTIFGKQPGPVRVVVVTPTGTEVLEVVVGDAPVVLPPGFEAVRQTEDLAERTSYEARYSSDPALFQNIFSFVRQQGDRTSLFHVNLASRTRPDSDLAPVSVPTASYRLSSPRGTVTLLDASVNLSPLTIEGATLRGVHLDRGGWRVHAGYTAYATFEHVLLPEVREAAAGASYVYRLSPRTAVVPSLFFFHDGSGIGSDGLAGSVAYTYRPRSDVNLFAEVGASRGLGFAVGASRARPGNRSQASVRCKPDGYASLAIDSLPGCFVNAGWNTTRRRFDGDVSLSATRATQPGHEHRNGMVNAALTFRLDDRWSLSTGLAASAFETERPSRLVSSSVGLPVGINFDTRTVGAGFRYQRSFGWGGQDDGDLWRVTGRVSAGGFSVSALVERETQALAVGSIVSQVPGLQQALDRLGLTATSPQQLGELTRQAALLAALGYAEPLVIDVSPERRHFWGSAMWAGRHPYAPRASLTSFVTRTDFVQGARTTEVHTASLTQKLGRRLDASVSYSLMRRDDRGARRYDPLVFVSLRPVFDAVPRFVLPGRFGTISGIVYRDDKNRGRHAAGRPGLAGVDVVLDGVRTVRTDASGRFEFSRVPYGSHVVEARVAGDQAYYFTTPSRVEVGADGRVEFGVGFSLGRVVGYVASDAGVGLPGLRVRVTGADGDVAVETGGEGRFELTGLQPGAYRVSLEAESVPPGYAIDSVSPAEVVVESGSSATARLVVAAHRAVAGRVRAFDRQSAAFVPVEGREVYLRELDRRCRTDANGAFVFRGLPAGRFTLEVADGSRVVPTSVTLAEGPTLLKDVDLRLPGLQEP